MHGIVNVLKSSGMTSQKVVSIIKHKLNAKKVGHLGTLDPSGTGVLPVCINKGTKLFDYFLNKDKIYRAVFVFGKTTDTLDSDGIITETCNKSVSKEDIEKVLPNFIGEISQIPPNYSRKCVNGVRAYTLARNNIDFELKPTEIEIYNIKLIEEINKNTFLFEIHCSSGTYIRSLVRDIAKSLNTVGYMGAIIRTKSGEFAIKDSKLIDEITSNDIIGFDDILEDIEIFYLEDKYYDKLINGVIINLNKNINKINVRLYCNNEFFGLANITNGQIRIVTNLR